MKKIFFTLFILVALLSQSCSDDDSRSPDNQLVEDAFARMYPGVGYVDWERKGSYWVADFRKDALYTEAWFSDDGAWAFTKTDVTFNALPLAVKESFASSEYATWYVDDVDILDRNGFELAYVLEVEKGNVEYDLYFSPAGQLIKAILDVDNDGEQYLPPVLSDNIKSYISLNYPQARIVDSEVEKGMTEVDIVDGTVYRELLFDIKGAWISTKTEVRKSELPIAVSTALDNSEYKSYFIEEIYLVETSGQKYYYFELESGGKDVNITITEDGVVAIV